MLGPVIFRVRCIKLAITDSLSLTQNIPEEKVYQHDALNTPKPDRKAQERKIKANIHEQKVKIPNKASKCLNAV